MTARRCANVLAGGAQSWRLACVAGRGGLNVGWLGAGLCGIALHGELEAEPVP